MNEINKSTAALVEVKGGEWVSGLPAVWHKGTHGTSFQNRQKTREMGWVNCMGPSGSRIPEKNPQGSEQEDRNEDPVCSLLGL